KPDPTLVRALTSADPMQRAAAACVLGRLTEQRASVQKLLTDRELRVRYEAASALTRGADKTGVPVLIDLLRDAPLPLAWPAEGMLYGLGHERSPAGLTSEAERGKVRDAWVAWWKEQGPALDLAKVSWDEEGRGVYLVCEAEGAGKPLTVTEYGPDGK